jgi:hypothetical protein
MQRSIIRFTFGGSNRYTKTTGNLFLFNHPQTSRFIVNNPYTPKQFTSNKTTQYENKDSDDSDDEYKHKYKKSNLTDSNLKVFASGILALVTTIFCALSYDITRRQSIFINWCILMWFCAFRPMFAFIGYCVAVLYFLLGR